MAERGLRDTVWTVDRIVMRVGTVGPEHPTDVLSGECLVELLSLPELGRDLGRGDELVPGGTLAAGALALGVVLG